MGLTLGDFLDNCTEHTDINLLVNIGELYFEVSENVNYKNKNYILSNFPCELYMVVNFGIEPGESQLTVLIEEREKGQK